MNGEYRCVQKNILGPWQTRTYENGVCEMTQKLHE
jgi:hypothetical protein